MMPDASSVSGADETDSGFSGAIHATTVMIDDRAVFIRGESGAGKSDLALRLIDRGAMLLSDDYTLVSAVNGRVLAETPPHIGGKIEVRGIGIVPFPHAKRGEVALVVNLMGDNTPPPERYPLEQATTRLCGLILPLLRIDGREASAPLKVELALREHLGAPSGKEAAQ